MIDRFTEWTETLPIRDIHGVNLVDVLSNTWVARIRITRPPTKFIGAGGSKTTAYFSKLNRIVCPNHSLRAKKCPRRRYLPIIRNSVPDHAESFVFLAPREEAHQKNNKPNILPTKNLSQSRPRTKKTLNQPNPLQTCKFFFLKTF